MGTSNPACRHLRVDAERNRGRILEAAQTAFAERGLEVPLEEFPMTQASFAAAGLPGPLATRSDEYQPGVCNIGPAEIASRRRAGHIGLVATIALLVALIAIGAPPLARLLVALPATIAASGYLQAWLRFCAGFGSRGVFNFDRVGETQRVEDGEARRRDRARATQIGVAALLIGVAVGVVAVLLPV